MATIVIHAGRPKAGSTAVQEFLRRNAERLASHGIKLAVATPARTDPGALIAREFDTGSVTSAPAARLLKERPELKPSAMAALTESLDHLARRCETLVLTSEGLAHFLWTVDREVLGPLDDLGHHHTVRVAQYVRPQHTALEASWRQWGFRSGRRPSVYLERRAVTRDYLKTQLAVGEIAPHIDLATRPFRRDLLEGSDVVVDFAFHFLGLSPHELPPHSQNLANVGLPLDIVNLLSRAPKGLLGPSVHYNRRLDMVKNLLAGIDDQASEAAQRGRELLQAWCHERFEPSNAKLIRQLEWRTDFFVPPIVGSPGTLGELDSLWRPRASPVEIEAFLRLLSLYLENEERTPSTVA